MTKLFWLWTLIGIGWIIYDTIFWPETWYNFTSWVWFFQTSFFFWYLLSKEENSLRDGYFLPVLFACEFTVALAVIYLMIVGSTLFDENVDENGPVLVWIGSAILHYVTLLFLLRYMYGRKYILRDDPPYKFILIIATFIIVYSYRAFCEPASHYGVAGISDAWSGFYLILVSNLGLIIYLCWVTM